MTTTVGVVCGDGIVLATDKRATMGSFIASKKARKVYDIGEKIGMTTAGAVGDLQALVRFMKAHIENYDIEREAPITVHAASTLLSNVLNRYYRSVQILIAGVDENGRWIYSIDAAGGVTMEDDIIATGSGSPTAYGVLEDRFEKDMSIERGKKLATKAVFTATKRDSASGSDFIEIAVITEANGYQTETIEREEIKDYIKDL